MTARHARPYAHDAELVRLKAGEERGRQYGRRFGRHAALPLPKKPYTPQRKTMRQIRIDRLVDDMVKEGLL